MPAAFPEQPVIEQELVEMGGTRLRASEASSKNDCVLSAFDLLLLLAVC